MATTETKCGWYGTNSETYFVSASGRAYLVQTDDLVDLSDGPRPTNDGRLPEGVQPIDEKLIDQDLWDFVENVD